MPGPDDQTSGKWAPPTGCLPSLGCGVLVVGVLGIFAWIASCSGSGTTSHPPATFVDGATALIGRDGDGLPCFASKESLESFVDSASKHDTYGGEQALEGAIYLHRGEHVRAISHAGPLWSEVQIRIESGDDEGAACWEPADKTGLFVSVEYQ